ncbi:gliding motility-associated protein GldE [Gilvibacter sediminis]|uniref:gliding motility-associated protein GldE n=1 Tax=Gilvibacter sediminis TaxID=379071 RepID=UPI0023501E0D|nr:gliding motility-associated protein GldE [Gilvibacter sediminis]MDC7997160.1 gliding motility-associated protein GldE [Gilvibacter sediminis]
MDLEPPSILLTLAYSNAISLAVILLLLLCSALISASEVAFFSLSSTDLESEGEKPSKKLEIVGELLSKPKKLLATILVSNNFINIAIILLFDSVAEVFFSGLTTDFLGIPVRFIVEVGVVTFFILLFGEILPKIYASRNNMSFALFMAYPLKVLEVLLSPLSLPMRSITRFIEGRFGRKKSNFSVDQLSQALELTSEDDTTQEEQKILQGIVTFGNTDAKQVMKPRMDLFALSNDQEFEAILPEIVSNGYSRIPVYQDNIDKITGVLYVKDLLPFLGEKKLDWVSLQREAYFVPENKKLDDLLAEFKEMKMHLAIVVDEYGGTSGLLSLEDILEEIVGEISDEFDDDDIIYSKLDDTTYVFEGKTPLKDVYKVIGLEDPTAFEENKGEAESLAGFLLEIAKGFPKKNEVLKFEHYTFTIEAFENKRIKQIKLTIKE